MPKPEYQNQYSADTDLSVIGSAAPLALPVRYVSAPSRLPNPLAVDRATFLKPRIVLGLFRVLWYVDPDAAHAQSTSNTRTVTAIMEYRLSDARIVALRTVEDL
jgi:hypothetical protein